MMSYYVHPTLNHVSLSLDVNECEEIDNIVGKLGNTDMDISSFVTDLV